MQSSQSMYNLSSFSSPQYIPSHLRQSHRTPQAPRSSPPRMRRSSTTSRFGGPSFGTPKVSRSSRATEASFDEAPPIESIYDYNGGTPFSALHSSAEVMPGVQTTPRREAATLSSLPCKVIIFGFPAQMTTKVLDYFSRFGEIEEHSSSTAQNLSMGSNWMKITYKNSASAQQAVSANGSLIGNEYMVGCVIAPEESLASIDSNIHGGSSNKNDNHHHGGGGNSNQDDAMDIDPQTPPRPRAVTQMRNNAYQTPMRPNSSNGIPSSTPGGRRIEVLSSDAIYKSSSPLSERAAAWVPSWLSGDEQSPPTTADSSATQATQQAEAGWPRRMLRGLVDTIFGF